MKPWLAGLAIVALGGAATPASSQVANPVFVVTATGAIPAALPALNAWLTQLDLAEYGASWDSASAAFQAATERAEWEKAVLQARGAFEPFGARQLITLAYSRDSTRKADGETVLAQYRTAVEGQRTVLETVTVAKGPDGRWRGAGYFVRLQP